MKSLFPLLGLLLFAVAARGETPVSADFFAGYYLETHGAGPFFRLPLPEEVYATVRSPDLSDMRVFNSAGETLPHALRAPDFRQETGEKVNVPFFPLHGDDRQALSANLAVEVVRDQAGTIVTVQDPGAGQVERLRGYLLDLGVGSHPGGTLELHWQPASPSSLFTVAIEQSGDLRGWWPLVSAAPLLDLRHHGERVLKREIVLPAAPQRYLRLSWREKEALLLGQVRLATKAGDDRREWQWSEVGSGEVKKPQDRLEIDYQADFRVPASSARLRFSRPNSLAKVDLQSRASAKDPWRSRCRQAFYNLTFGTAQVESGSCAFTPTTDTLWRVTVEEDGAGIATSRVGPSLSLGRLASELLFVARGTPPYLLAFASARPLEQGGREGRLVLEALEATEAAASISPASLGKRIELGGETVLRSPAPSPPWKTWLLWGVLFLGVAMLALMSRNLLREMKDKKENSATNGG